MAPVLQRLRGRRPRDAVDAVPEFTYSSTMRYPSDDLAQAANEGAPVAIVRLTGEVTTKARRTRARFQRILARNIEAAFATSGQPCELRESWSRLVLRLESGGSFDPLSRVFGISSYSVLDGVSPARLPEIVETGTRLFTERVRGRSFAVRARRSGKQAFSSMDIAVELGAVLDRHATVDLRDPEVEVHVEVRGDTAFFFSAKHDGAGGLPLGTEGRAISSRFSMQLSAAPAG